MTEAQVVQVVLAYLARRFPKQCNTCGRNYASLRQYVELTRPIGPVQSVDAEVGEWDTRAPIGTLAFANCGCGSTLVLSTDALPTSLRLALLAWLKEEVRRTGSSVVEVLDRIRDAVREAAARPAGSLPS